MKVLFISRSTLNSVRGGDSTQVYGTAAALRQLGVDVDVKSIAEVEDVNAYDIVHYFNLIRPADLVALLPGLRVPLVVSTIYVDYSEFDQKERSGLFALAANTLSKHRLEHLKAFIRHVKGQDRIPSWQFALMGQKRSMQRVLDRAAMLLPNSMNEMKRIEADFGAHYPYKVVPNAVSEDFFANPDDVERIANRILCVGQIEGRKNLHRIIEAIRGLDVELIVVGTPSPNNTAYLERCTSRADSRVRFVGFVSGQELIDLYYSSKVHVSASWFETTGLTSLEAGACGCNLVVSDRGDTKDYFDDYAEFCQPDDLSSICSSIETALVKSCDQRFSQKIRTSYLWAHSAETTLEAYNEVLKKQ